MKKGVGSNFAAGGRRKLERARRSGAMLLVLVGLMALSPGTRALAGEPEDSTVGGWRLVRFLPLDRFAPGGVAGLAWNPVSDSLVTLDGVEGGRDWRTVEVFRHDEPMTTTPLQAGRLVPLTLTFDAESTRLVSLLRDGLVAYGLDETHAIAPDRSLERVRRLARDPRGMTVDPESGTVFLLDGVRPRLVRVDPIGADGGIATVLRTGGVSTVALRGSDLAGSMGLTYDTEDGLLYTIGEDATLLAMSVAGHRVASWDLGAIGITAPAGIVAAPSGDATDAPHARSLYILDVQHGPFGAIAEISPVMPEGGPSLATVPETPGVVNQTAALIRTTQTSQYSPPSPDPAGITYLGGTGRLLISDSEVEEMSIFQGKNLFETRLSGSLFGSTNTLAFSDEPTGLEWNPVNGHLFVSDDDARTITELRAGGDGRFGTSDDTLTQFSTRPFDDMDPEGVAFDHVLNSLYIIDGVNREVYKVRPGPNGAYDGVDDVITHWDVGVHGLTDPEGIGYNAASGTLFLADKGTKKIYETTLAGSLLRVIDISAAHPSSPAGVAYAPSSANPAYLSLWVVDRAADNDSNPSENDGKLYELSLPGDVPVPNQPPAVDAGPPQVVTLAAGAALDGTVSDDGLPVPPGAVTTTWSKLSGPGTVTFGSASAVDTTADFSTVGSYVLRLSASDGSLSNSDDVAVDVVDAAGQYLLDRTVASSSDDAEQALSGSMSLSSSDLEIVEDGGTQQIVGIRFVNVTIPQGAFVVNAWVQFTVDEVDSGPATVQIEGQAADSAATFTSTVSNVALRARTSASIPWSPPAWTTVGAVGSAQRTPNIAPVIGEIVNRSGWASGNALVLILSGAGQRTAESFDGSEADAPRLHVEYNTDGPPPNSPPSVDAGPDRTVTMPSAASLDGMVSDDGYPIPPGTMTIAWSKVSGPGTVIFGAPGAVDTTATFSAAGTYVLQLSADDGAEVRTDTMTVSVAPAPVPNQPPVVNAGANQSVVYPNSANLNGSVMDDGQLQPWTGGWTEVSGPGTVAFFSPGSASTTASFSVPGTYLLRLTAFDGQYTVSDDVSVTVTQVGGTTIPVERRVVGSADDAEESDSGSMSLTSSDLELVQDGGKHQWVGIRFTNITIPRYATILNAWVRFAVDEVSTGPSSLLIEGQADDFPAAFTGTTGNISSRARTFNSVPWSPPEWLTIGASGADQTATGLAPVIQEIVSRPGWGSGNPIVLILTGTGERVAESFEGSSATAPLLHIEYDPEPVGNLPPQVSALAPATVIMPFAAALDGEVVDEGLPNPPGAVTTTWSKLSGPGSVTFGDAAAVDTEATFGAPGVYQLKLEAFDGELTTSASVTITVLAEGSPQSVDIRVGSSIDDVEEKDTGLVSSTSSDLELVYDGGNQTVGMRFANVVVPPASTITAAWVQFTVDEDHSGTASLLLRAQATDDAPVFTTAALDVSSRAPTVAAVPWSPTAWITIGEAGAAERTPDLREIIQEVVSRPGWAEGNAIVLMVTGSGERVAKSYDGNPSQAALLHIEYQN